MALNKAYLGSTRTKDGDEVYTPFYAVEPLVKFLEPFRGKIIWCPFDEEWSAFVQLLRERGFQVIHSSITDGQDFFEYTPDHFDLIVSNPPFSKKDKILKRCYELGKPFALLLPVNSLQSQCRVDLFAKYGVEVLVFRERINYHTRQNFESVRDSNHFGSAYFCYKLLPQQLVFDTLNPYERKLK